LPLGDSKVPRRETPTARRIVLAIRVLLLLVAGGAVAVAFALARAPAGASVVRYVCPMHPDVITTVPGECPVCRMALEPAQASAPAAAPNHGEMDADWRAVENVRRHDVIDVVRPRSLLFDVREMRGPASVESDGSISALFYNDQVAALAADEAGTFSPTARPKATIAVRRLPDASSAWDSSTSRIRFELRPAPTVKPPPPGTVGWIELARKQRQVLTVPASAVLQSSTGPYVLEFTDGFHLKKQAIQIGETFSGLGISVVLSGLRPAERVISRAAFFLDAERRQSPELEDGSP
jgi:hypothetical protein